jgi:hypothetical protein
MGLLRLENGITRRIFLAPTALFNGGDKSEFTRLMSHLVLIEPTIDHQKFSFLFFPSPAVDPNQRLLLFDGPMALEQLVLLCFLDS